MSSSAGDTSLGDSEASTRHSLNFVQQPPQLHYLSSSKSPFVNVHTAAPVDGGLQLPSTGQFVKATAAPQDEEVIRSEDADESDIVSDEGSLQGIEELVHEEEKDRPNKYYGPPSTWRDWTREERLLSASLEQIRADNLSIHLYNAHKLKQRLWSRPQLLNLKPWQHKRHWIDESKRNHWYPDEAWTAWPLKYEDVPCQGENFGSNWNDEAEDCTITAAEIDVKPSAEMEEVLIAAVLKAAKEKFVIREDEGEDDHQCLRGSSHSQVDTNVEPRSGDNPNPDTAADFNPPEEAIVKPLEQQDDLEPLVLMADDEKARRILTPTIRSVLSNFDVVLMGLHRARQTYASKMSRSSKSSIKRSTDNNGSGQPRAQERSSFSSSESSYDETGPPTYRDISRSRYSASSSPSRRDFRSSSCKPDVHRSRDNLPRDWSDVLGVASMQGWNAAVIQRTAQRCAGIFGEGISFRVLPENAASTANHAPVNYAPGRDIPLSLFVEDAPRLIAEVVSGPLRLPVIPGSLSCPHPDCRRHGQPYAALHRLTEHVRRAHGYDPRQVEVYGEKEEMAGGVHVVGFLRPVEARRADVGRKVRKRKAKETTPRQKVSRREKAKMPTEQSE